MGNKEFKPVTICYEDAVKRVSEPELRRLREAYRRTCLNGHMDRATFHREIMGPGVPNAISDQIYEAFGGGKHLSFKDLLCGLVLFTRAKEKHEERLKFLFGLYADDDLRVHKHRMDERILQTDGEVPESISELFEHKDEVDYETFKLWLRNYPEFSSLSHWLQFEPCALRLTEKQDLPSFYQTLAGVTHLTEHEIMALENKYWQLKKTTLSGKFDVELFRKLVSPPLPLPLTNSLFRVFDENADGHVDFKELVCGLSACCRGPSVERQKFCFKVFDMDRDGFLSRPELVGAIESSFAIIRSGQANESTADLLDLDPYQMAKEIIQSHGTVKDNRLTREEYLCWAVQSKIPQSFADMLFEVCHVILGLRPVEREGEGKIVKGWLARETKRGYVLGQTWYLISDCWWRKWNNYVSTGMVAESMEVDDYNVIAMRAISSDRRNSQNSSGSSQNSTPIPPPRPAAIDNTHLVVSKAHAKVKTLTNEGGVLKSGLQVDKDFHVLPEALWTALFSWYFGGPQLPRLVIKNEEDQPCLELHQIRVKLYKHVPSSRAPSGPVTTFTGVTENIAHFAMQATGWQSSNTMKRALTNTACFSHRHTLRQVIEFLAKTTLVNRDDIRLWKYDGENDMELPEDEDKCLTAVGIASDCSLLMEVRNRDQTWPEEMMEVAKKPHDKKHKDGSQAKVEQGVTGLSNLGNTCFMNSAIQCVSNTKPLTKYFNSGLYLYEINKTNVMGMKGMLAKMYGELVKSLWNGVNKTLVPLDLRYTLSKYAPQFSGHQQHDSQELLSFLLDGLHEDLNRVPVKKYIELKDSDGRPDEIVAREAWENHRMSNKSIIVDLFHGQLKSAIRCKECNHVSVRFDPFSYLSLPLPLECSITVDVILLRLDGSRPVRYGFKCNSDEKYLAIRMGLSEKSGIPADQLVLTELIGSQIKTFAPDSEKLRKCNTGYIYAYEVNEPIERDAPTPEREGSPNPQTNGHIPSAHVQATARAANNSGSSSPTSTLSSKSTCAITELRTEHDQPLGTIVALHRKTERREFYFHVAQQCTYSNFGVPILLQIKETTTNKDLYHSVWTMIKRLVTGHPVTESCNHAQDCDGSLGNEYPFILKSTQSNGVACSICKYFKFCSGCSIEYSEDLYTDKSGYIVIDWDPTALHLRYQSSQEIDIIDDASVEASRTDNTTIDLYACLDAFTHEEELTEPYHCKKCKKHQVASKKLEIWRLPPILIIHLKRFQFVNGRWVKSHKGVKFPLTDFDPEMYLSSRGVDHGDHTPTTTPLATPNGSFNPTGVIHEEPEGSDTEPTSSSADVRDVPPSFPPVTRRKTLSTTSFDSLDYFQAQYQLYSMSCHRGVLGGGHYVAYCKNPNDTWYEYNDSMVKPVPASQLDHNTAYILFYERREFNFGRLMPGIEGKTADTSCFDEEMQSGFKKSLNSNCVIQ